MLRRICEPECYAPSTGWHPWSDCFQDADKGGNITVEEFGRVMKKTDPNVTDAEVAKIVKEVDLDGDGTINFDGKKRSTARPVGWGSWC